MKIDSTIHDLIDNEFAAAHAKLHQLTTGEAVPA